MLICFQARVEEVVSWVWDVFQPLLFGLIGAEIRISELEGHTVGESISMHSMCKEHAAGQLLTQRNIQM